MSSVERSIDSVHEPREQFAVHSLGERVASELCSLDVHAGYYHLKKLQEFKV